jgi:hypothetical protein
MKARWPFETLNLLRAHLTPPSRLWPQIMPLSAPDQRTVG